LDEAKGVKG